jgi:Sigma-54 interaction domain
MIKEFFENLVFAMNFDAKISEHMIKEFMNKNKNKDDRIEREAKALFLNPILGAAAAAKAEAKAETEAEGIDVDVNVDEFNAEVDRKLKGKTHATEEDFFSEIVGYVDIKKLIMKCIQSDAMHVILDGPPASAKSMFLMEMEKNLNNTYFVDCTNATGPGMVEYLFKNDVKYLLLDEVEKMSKTDQNVLLNVLETGILISTKVRETDSKKMNISVYATTNDIDAISKPFRSRFMEFSLPSYTYEEFCDIAVNLLAKRYNSDKELSLKVTDTIWNKIGSKDVRNLLQVGKLSKTVDDVEFVAATLKKYMRRNDEE